jgi:hypothetical protein
VGAGAAAGARVGAAHAPAIAIDSIHCERARAREQTTQGHAQGCELHEPPDLRGDAA